VASRVIMTRCRLRGLEGPGLLSVDTAKPWTVGCPASELTVRRQRGVAFFVLPSYRARRTKRLTESGQSGAPSDAAVLESTVQAEWSRCVLDED